MLASKSISAAVVLNLSDQHQPFLQKLRTKLHSKRKTMSLCPLRLFPLLQITKAKMIHHLLLPMPVLLIKIKKILLLSRTRRNMVQKTMACSQTMQRLQKLPSGRLREFQSRKKQKERLSKDPDRTISVQNAAKPSNYRIPTSAATWE